MSHQRQLPKGWHLAGSRPELYQTGVLAKAFGEAAGLSLTGTEPTDGFGTAMQGFKADAYRGQRLRYSAAVRAEGVERWAGLWMRVDGPDKGRSLAFDNMQERPIRGTVDWERHAVVLDVPEAGTGIWFGILLTGPGRVWLADVRIEPVSTDVPVTDTTRRRLAELPDHPVNLDFSETDPG